MGENTHLHQSNFPVDNSYPILPENRLLLFVSKICLWDKMNITNMNKNEKSSYKSEDSTLLSLTTKCGAASLCY